jgi:hypothetical protein
MAKSPHGWAGGRAGAGKRSGKWTIGGQSIYLRGKQEAFQSSGLFRVVGWASAA